MHRFLAGSAVALAGSPAVAVAPAVCAPGEGCPPGSRSGPAFRLAPPPCPPAASGGGSRCSHHLRQRHDDHARGRQPPLKLTWLTKGHLAVNLRLTPRRWTFRIDATPAGRQPLLGYFSQTIRP